MNRLYRIKRNSDQKYYKGKSKFTEQGTYFRVEQVEGCLKWLKILTNSDISIISYEITEEMSVNIKNIDMTEMTTILNRYDTINTIIDKEDGFK